MTVICTHSPFDQALASLQSPAWPNPAALTTMSSMDIYLREEGAEIGQRIRAKILGAAAAGAVGSTAWAVAGHRKLIRTVPGVTANAAIGMAAFAVCQEGLRAVRQGEHDAWNSFGAGALAGGVLTRSAYGRGFHLLGLVMWGPLCGSLHWLNSKLRPSAAIQSFLISRDLMDAPAAHLEQQQQQAAAAAAATAAAVEQQAKAVAAVQPQRLEDFSYREKKKAVEEIRQRELERLHAAMKEQQAAAAAGVTAAAGISSSAEGSGQQQGARRKWW